MNNFIIFICLILAMLSGFLLHSGIENYKNEGLYSYNFLTKLGTSIFTFIIAILIQYSIYSISY